MVWMGAENKEEWAGVEGDVPAAVPWGGGDQAEDRGCVHGE